jgi:hypothetical protein
MAKIKPEPVIPSTTVYFERGLKAHGIGLANDTLFLYTGEVAKNRASEIESQMASGFGRSVAAIDTSLPGGAIAVHTGPEKSWISLVDPKGDLTINGQIFCRQQGITKSPEAIKEFMGEFNAPKFEGARVSNG